MRYFVKRDEPFPKHWVRSTDFTEIPTVTPEAMYSIFGGYLTHNDPWVVSAFPIPTEGSVGNAQNDQGRTEVVFTLADGTTQLKGRMLYVDKGQINLQAAPLKLYDHIGEMVTVSVVLNGTVSIQSFPVKVTATDPGVFVTDWKNQIAAAVVVKGKKAGQIVTAGNGPSAGDVIAVYGTGLGRKLMDLPEGMPATGADPALANVAAKIGGQDATVYYAGAAPLFPGLDQINIQVPLTISSGNQPLVISAGGLNSAATIIPIE
jgi:uncharacterized protein (TIGR03437 family)